MPKVQVAESLFVTCIVDQFFPDVGMSMARVLERAGCTLQFPPDQTCCGQPAFNSGYRDEACKVAQHTLEVFQRCRIYRDSLRVLHFDGDASLRRL